MAKSPFHAAVKHFWATRQSQQAKQTAKDAGRRGEVTGGKQMSGFIDLLAATLQRAGVPAGKIFTATRQVVLPGYFRPTKEWDLLAVAEGALICAIEVKSHVGPSFGNNFNNRSEEAIGTAADFQFAFKHERFPISPKPWLGYLILIEDCAASNRAVGVAEPHFTVFDEFRDASYIQRYEILCRRLVLENQYDAACLLTSRSDDANRKTNYAEPAAELAGGQFLTALEHHARGAMAILANKPRE